MSSELRPDPDAILKRIHQDERQSRRGKLRVFFGMCPGVGKTYAMLRAAQERRTAGVDVVAGVIETHGRAETEALLGGLERIPLRELEHKGTRLVEFDLDGALERRPAILLVDELAHSNAPGSRHPKRYQDVEELLAAGIDVYTTLNVQHVESRADLVYQISGAPVRETVPDSFLEFADQVELIDLTPEALLGRLREGKVYLGERAARAEEGFFREEKLTALRELALRFTAELVDDQLRTQMQAKRIDGPWNTNERLMVAISHSPFTSRLIRAARRMAYSLEAPWVALYVDTGLELTSEDQETLGKNLALAREMGAEVVMARDRSVAEALRRTAAERNVTQIVMGRPDRSWLRDWFGKGNVLDQLVNETSEVDIHVIRQKRKPIYRGWRPKFPEATSPGSAYLRTLAYVALLVAIGYPLQFHVGYQAVGFAFLLGLLPVATVTGMGPTIFGAAASALAWNYLFIPPRFTFAIGQSEDIMMILAYFAVAVVAAWLTSRIKRHERDLTRREAQAQALYAFGRQVSEARGLEEIISAAVRGLGGIFPGQAAILPAGSDGQLVARAVASEKDRAVAAWAFANARRAGWRTDTLASASCLCLPLRGHASVVGVAMLYPAIDRPLTLEQEHLLDTAASQLATALERERLEDESRRAEIYAKSEKLHQDLLNSVSHELRTPLTAIVGGATALREASADPTRRAALLEDVIGAAGRLSRTIENLLDMSRLSSGALEIARSLFELNDFVRAYAARAAELVPAHRIELALADEDLFVRGDEKLLEHVLQNLIVNASQHSPPGSRILVRTGRNQAYAELVVADEGPGIPDADRARIFERFYRAGNTNAGGVGLGLYIVRGIVEAHGGIALAANQARGAAFTVLLPAEEVPSEVLQ